MILTEVPETALYEAVDEVNELVGPVQEFIKALPGKALSLGIRIVLALIFFAIGSWLIKLVRRLIRNSITRAGAEMGVRQFVDSFVKTSAYVVLVLFIASYFGVDAAGIVALLGSAGVAIGLAVQGSLSNLAGGVLILILKPFVVGDYIEESASGREGTVTEIQIFYTKLLTADNHVVVLPNGSLANTSIVNYTSAKDRRASIAVGISYKADIKSAREALENVLKSDEKTLKDREMAVFVDELGASSVNLCVRCWFANEDYWQGKWRITEKCKLALDEAGIEIPYSQLDVHFDK
ncbi:MAG: mechanosensitive ion channel [Lachnospiraceae bacterium]|nr:mechanosensitive ion channel [Lachnospiraceae bacterium]